MPRVGIVEGAAVEPGQQRLDVVVDAILRYLHQYPEAADTVEGIARWWLPSGIGADPETVSTALRRLQEQGLVHQRTNADHQVVFLR